MPQLIVNIDESLLTESVAVLLPALRRLDVATAGQDLVLGCDSDGLFLRDPTSRAGVTRVDFLDAGLHYRLRTSGKRQGLAKAVGLDKVTAGRRLQVLDATAGLGRDALVLAWLGCEVIMLEQHPVMHALLADGLARGLRDADDAFRVVLQRLRLQLADARQWLVAGPGGDQASPDVVYLDPMFPPRDKSALVKKDMALLHQLLGSEQDLASLVVAARAAARHRVVLKRPDGKLPAGVPAPTLWVGEAPATFAVYVNSSFSSMRQ